MFTPWLAPGLARAQGRPARIGYISLRPGPNEFDQAFVRGLRERGWVDGQNLAIDFRWAAFESARVDALVSELLALQPALMLCADVGVGAVRRLKSPVPMVHPAFGDAIAGGFTTSMARPDGNVTGSSVLATELAFKRIELLKQAVPSLPTITYRAQLGELARKHRLATIFANRSYLRGGGLMSYGPDLEGAFYRAAYFVDRILKGAKPADLPIEQPTTYQLALHQGTARALGLRLPQGLLLRADEVIE